MPNNTRGRRSGAPAAALLSPDKPEAPKPAPKVIDAAKTVTDEVPQAPLPIGEATKAEHERRQRELREWMAKMSGETPAELAEAERAAESVEDVPAQPVETPEARSLREGQERLEAYWSAVAAMEPDEPVYVVGVRPPRPQYNGLVLDLGDVVPGACRWPRLESWVRSGVIVPQAQGIAKTA